MAVLNPLKKGLLLYGDSRRDPAPTDELLRYAERYMEDEGYSDALNFYFAAGSEDGVKNILSTAVSTGDFFLYRRACEMMGWETNRDDLMSLAENARASGKLAFARDAYLKAGDDRKAGEIEKLMGD